MNDTDNDLSSAQERDALADDLTLAWHDVTCPESAGCRSRTVHALNSTTLTTVGLIRRALLAAGWTRSNATGHGSSDAGAGDVIEAAK